MPVFHASLRDRLLSASTSRYACSGQMGKSIAQQCSTSQRYVMLTARVGAPYILTCIPTILFSLSKGYEVCNDKNSIIEAKGYMIAMY